MKSLKKDVRIAPFIKEIFLFETDNPLKHKLPFYADGYPGIMYSETEQGVILQPLNKLLPNFFLYGQTIEPIELEIDGPYKIIVFQLYPFATRILLDINPKEINDACYDLIQVKNIDTPQVVNQIETATTNNQIDIISSYVLKLVENASTDYDNSIKLAVSTIVNTKGTLPINQLREQLYLTERTFERRFSKEIGVTPKQFSKIIQFSFSLNQIKESDYTKLTNIAYENGFTDQSHFIKTFKKYTGATPKEVLSKLS